MKVFVFLALAFIAKASAHPTTDKTIGDQLVGANKCTWGPSYWCQNLTTAGGCHATKHCIQTDWIYRQMEPDNTSICQTCLDMVKQARDQLESNETQELIKEVFEGSCALIHFKPLVVECDRIVDSFIPDLIETLASRMNPTVVCSVAGLCNNENFLKWQNEQSVIVPLTKAERLADTCNGCNTVIGIMRNNFERMSKDEVLERFLTVCGKASSLSDACSNIVLTYFSTIYEHLQKHFNPEEVCLLSGECSAKFHPHSGVEVTSMSKIGYLHVNSKQEDDMACDFCKQLVEHLRDLLVANTTEAEFKQVLEGLCKQTGSFSEECTNIVEEYYPALYNFLLVELKPDEVCGMVGVCPKNLTDEVPIRPLLPVETADSFEARPAVARVQLTKIPIVKIISAPKTAPLEDFANADEAQLPIELMVPSVSQSVYNKEVCQFCEYFLHYVQQVITTPTTEDKIREIIDKACEKLPNSINTTCVGFVETYEPALVALLAQEIDPSVICPLIRACPSADSKDVDVFMEQTNSGNKKCPLCLFAVTKLEDMVKDKKTEDEIKEALGKLCSELSSNLKKECTDFVDSYAEQLVEMIIADLNPQEVCVYLKLCTDKNPAPELPESKKIGGDVDTNMIVDNTINGVVVNKDVGSAECFVCKTVMGKIEKIMEDNKGNIINDVKSVCETLPLSMKRDCLGFMEKYESLVIDLLIKLTDPAIICQAIQVCSTRGVIPTSGLDEPLVGPFKDGQCIICKLVMERVDALLKKDKDHIESVVKNVCDSMPDKIKEECEPFIEEYGDTIIQFLIVALDPKDVCGYIKLCPSTGLSVKDEILDCAVCEVGVEIMEKILNNGLASHDVVHVMEKTCRALPHRLQPKCTKYMDKYGTKMYNSVLKKDESVCHKIGVCANEAAVPVISGLPEKKHTPARYKIRPVLYKPVY